MNRIVVPLSRQVFQFILSTLLIRKRMIYSLVIDRNSVTGNIRIYHDLELKVGVEFDTILPNIYYRT